MRSPVASTSTSSVESASEARGGALRVEVGPVGGGRGAGPREGVTGLVEGRGGVDGLDAALAVALGPLDGRGTAGAETRGAEGTALGRGGAWLGRTLGGGEVRAVGRGAGNVCGGWLFGPDAEPVGRAQPAHRIMPRASGTGRTTWVPHMLHKTAIREPYQTSTSRRANDCARAFEPEFSGSARERPP
ncbi:MAG: hypothetical protein ACHREM_29975 [Polyangiales bacterium]